MLLLSKLVFHHHWFVIVSVPGVSVVVLGGIMRGEFFWGVNMAVNMSILILAVPGEDGVAMVKKSPTTMIVRDEMRIACCCAQCR